MPGLPGTLLFQRHFLLGRCVSAEAAAVFAAGLDFGLLRTFDAADAAFALVTSLLDFAILITSFPSLHVRSSLSVVDSLLTKTLVRHMFYDEVVGFLAKEKGLMAASQILRYRHNIAYGGVLSTSQEGDGIFASRLRAAREQRGLNQTELAKRSGLQPAAIGHFEADRRKPSFANIRALAKALDVSSDFLLGRAASLQGATTAFRNEESLTADDRDTIQMMINTLAKRRQGDGS